MAGAVESERRAPTRVDAVAERWLQEFVALRPEYALAYGIPGHESRYSDLSPDGLEAIAAVRRKTLTELTSTPALDEVDAITKAELTRDLELDLEHHETGLPFADVNTWDCPVQMVRVLFDLEADQTRDDWERIAQRLRNVPAALETYATGLRHGARTGSVPAIRQVRLAATEAAETAAVGGPFAALAHRGAARADVPSALKVELERAADAAASAYGALAEVLEEEIAPRAREDDGVGRDAYDLASRRALGGAVDLEETYRWGLDALQGAAEEQQRVAHRIAGGGVEDAIARLDADPRYTLEGSDALRAWMQERSDRVIEALAGTVFDIPDSIRRLECRIAPTPAGGASYSYWPPSSDLSRPGTMWVSLPAGQRRFSTWRDATVVHHEGVPGHHLQLATPIAEGALNAWRRTVLVPGHAEGWALYAEHLMVELGFLDDPGDLLGMLDARRLRAARVVIHLGLHLGLRDPDGETWTYQSALELLTRNVHRDEAFLRAELDRYCGLPALAASHLIGERIWRQTRAAAASRPDYDLRTFHRTALALGGIGLDTLKGALG